VRLTLGIPAWGLLLLAVAVLGLALFTYRRAPASTTRRAALAGLRALALGLVVFCLLGPAARAKTTTHHSAVVAILLDHSRSMALDDGTGRTRLDRASAVVRDSIVPSLSREWPVETLLFGDGLGDTRDVALSPTAARTDLSGAIRATLSRFAPRGLAGIIVVSDGARTDSGDLAELGRQGGTPIVAVGVGSAGVPDVAVRSVATSESRLDLSLVDVTVTVDATGVTQPFDLRLLQNGRVIDRRTLTPNGAAQTARFTVAPDRDSPTVFTADVPAISGELTAGNNRRSVLVAPPGRRRRLLVLEGAPGFDHAFLTRSWSEDPSLDVDSVVRKGRDERGEDTFFVQAAGIRAEGLAAGFPATREALFAYDVVVLANQDVRLLSQEQLGWLRDFVGTRGGGLLALGARSFDGQALAGTPVEELLPLRPSEGGGVVLAASVSGGATERPRLTADGSHHPMMRIGATDEEGARRWNALPALAGHVKLGAARPGAVILAVTDGESGQEPLVAVQRYGAGRTMIFGGEASWRWKMMLPAGDRTYDRFWRQAARWLSADAPDQIALDPIASVEDNGEVAIAASVRDAGFKAAPDATMVLQLERPDGRREQITPTLADSATARFTARVPSGDAGITRVHAEVSKGGTPIGTADAPFLSGAFDRELADPRLDARTLSLLAESSGGTYLTADHAAEAARFLRSRSGVATPDEWTEIWHSPWMLGLIVAVLGVEWTLRRQWGLK
jgi:uncharacterized membrane protein